MRVCVYAGSFDPPTNGHLWMIRQGAKLFDRLIVAIGINPYKSYTFAIEERLAMLKEMTKGMANVKVKSYSGMFLIDFAKKRHASFILRGIRSEDDYEFEAAMRMVNSDINPDIATVYLIPPRELIDISSSLVKGLVGSKGWQKIAKKYVPVPVYASMLKKFKVKA